MTLTLMAAAHPFPPASTEPSTWVGGEEDGWEGRRKLVHFMLLLPPQGILAQPGTHAESSALLLLHPRTLGSPPCGAQEAPGKPTYSDLRLTLSLACLPQSCPPLSGLGTCQCWGCGLSRRKTLAADLTGHRRAALLSGRDEADSFP